MTENQAVIHERVSTKANNAGNERQMGLLGRSECNGKSLGDRDDQEAQCPCPDVRDANFNDFRESCEYPENIMWKEDADAEEQNPHTKRHAEGEPYRPAYVNKILGTKKLCHKRRCSAYKPKDKQPVYKKELH